MGRAPCCEKVGLKRGRWTAEEDELLRKYIEANGEGSWRSLPKNAGLLRCGKSCRLRWINYLRSDVKRGDISADEEDIIINLHSSLGNRWSLIAGHLPGRTDNEIKNYWNSHLSRKIQSFRKPNTNFVIPPPLVKANRRTGCRTTIIINKKKKKKKNKMQMDTTTVAATTKQIEENMTSNVMNGAASNSNGEVPLTMPTTPTPEKEALSSSSVMPTVPEEGLMKVVISTAETENTSLVLPLDEGNVRICQGIGNENAILCLDDILEDLNGIWGFDEDKDNGGIATSGDDKKNMFLGGMEDSSRRQECMNNGNYCDTEEWNLMRSPALNSWEWDWDDSGATGNGNRQEENTFSWFWDADQANNDSELGCDKHTATMHSWLLS